MKILMNREDKEFRPIEVMLILENKAECDTILFMTTFNHSIPELFLTGPDRKIIMEFLGKLRRCLKDA